MSVIFKICASIEFRSGWFLQIFWGSKCFIQPLVLVDYGIAHQFNNKLEQQRSDLRKLQMHIIHKPFN